MPALHLDSSFLPRNDLPIRAAARLQQQALALETISKPKVTKWAMQFADLVAGKPSAYLDLEKALGKRCCSIYLFHLGESVRSASVLEAIEIARRNKHESRAYPRINKVGNTPENRCLYVGSSRSTGSRIAQHLGFGPLSTYSLHLRSWTTKFEGGFEIEVLQYEGINLSLLPMLEDQLAEELKPILGRRGSR